ncbi:Armadillo-like helical domain-containing protein 3, C-terminal [Popillia japonica]|uniref:Armadillo-like helical domain-containing protein 3, C-terminal n=1 Tax=Popillia japonica TaxID=7064 RepID=A0AAW1KPM1_POPJA
MSTRKRSGSGSKRQLKEKVVQIYESFFRGDDLSKNNPTFWEELFLLKPKVSHLENEIQKITPDQLGCVKENINELFSQCVETLGHEHNIRIMYAMQTLCGLVHATYKKATAESGFDIINLLVGFKNAEQKMQKLLDHCHSFLTGDYPDSLKGLCLKLLLVFVTGTENVSQNTLVEYIMITSMFECLMQLLCDTPTRQKHGHDVVLLLTLLVNYRKHEAANPYIVKLSILDDELALNGYGQVITASLTEFCRQFTLQQSELQNASWLSSLTNMVGNMFISEEGAFRTQQIRANNALLVALYEAIHLNRNFITTLAQTQTDTSLPPSPSNTLNAGLTPTDVSNMVAELMAQPSNLLVTFFQYCSIVMQDTKTEGAEDQYANSLMHDISLTFKVHLHRMPMRHRKITADKLALSQPLASTLLDLLVEFIMSHMMKKFPMELYVLCIGVIHRILCYQKRCRIRINYQWKELWTALITLLRFLVQNETNLTKKMNIFDLSIQLVNILNLFITYGDTFLPTPGSYDELYYELIRMHQVFDNVYTMGLRYSTGDGEFKDYAQKLNNTLINIRAIIKHFSPKIEQWLTSQSLSTPSEDQILEVVRKNYDSLTLKLQDSLDQYERYSEKQKHTQFFTSMVRNVVSDTRQTIDFASIDLQVILQDFSSIS